MEHTTKGAIRIRNMLIYQWIEWVPFFTQRLVLEWRTPISFGNILLYWTQWWNGLPIFFKRPGYGNGSMRMEVNLDLTFSPEDWGCNPQTVGFDPVRMRRHVTDKSMVLTDHKSSSLSDLLQLFNDHDLVIERSDSWYFAMYTWWIVTAPSWVSHSRTLG